jgi:plastocyanin
LEEIMSIRIPLWISAIVCVAACGGGEKAQNQATGASTSVATPATGASTSVATPGAAGAVAAMPATGASHAVQMVQDAASYHFSPANITVKQGDAVTFTVSSGLPHNVTFWPDSIPPGAAAQLSANMPNATAPLTGPLLANVGATYTISFAGVPPGVYKMYCTPHLQYGMKATITVQ